jgi:DNA gyrase inhibitor GyrI
MAPDPITQKHLDRLRIRGAPATIPGAAGLVGAYDGEETWRQTCRAFVTPIAKPLHIANLREAFAKLRSVAEAQKVQVVEEPLLVLRGDPNEDPPHKWEYEAALPIRGAGKAEEGVTLARIEGGMHIASLTGRGLPDLMNLYVFLFGKFLPSKKQQLMRPTILHSIVEGLDKPNARDEDLIIAAYVPAVLSIKPVPVPGESTEAT